MHTCSTKKILGHITFNFKVDFIYFQMYELALKEDQKRVYKFIQVCPMPECSFIYKTSLPPKRAETRMIIHLEEDHAEDFRAWPYYAQQYHGSEVNMEVHS